MQYFSFCIWLILLNMLICSSTHFPAKFILLCGWICLPYFLYLFICCWASGLVPWPVLWIEPQQTWAFRYLFCTLTSFLWINTQEWYSKHSFVLAW
jgi:hypothetical protein